MRGSIPRPVPSREERKTTMLLHRVKMKAGVAVRAGTTFHGYKAVCGAPIIAGSEIALGSTVAVGPEPHAQCSKCFRQQADDIDVRLPDDPLAAPVYDEQGRAIPGKREREDGLGPVTNTHEMNLGDSNGLGQYENRPYG
jgi:hypothetical protein